MRYILKDEYKGVSICPSYKEINLEFCSQDQIKLLIKAGYTEYFTEVDTTKKSKSNKKDLK